MTRAPILRKPRDDRAASTLVEVLITSSLVVVVGGLVFLSLHAGVHLFGKNIAVNLPYQASRAAFDVLQRDLHGSAAAPRLIDASLTSVSAPGPAAGVALRNYSGGRASWPPTPPPPRHSSRSSRPPASPRTPAT